MEETETTEDTKAEVGGHRTTTLCENTSERVLQSGHKATEVTTAYEGKGGSAQKQRFNEDAIASGRDGRS